MCYSYMKKKTMYYNYKKKEYDTADNKKPTF